MKKLILYSNQIVERIELDKELLALLGKENPKIGYIPSCADIERKYFNITSEYYKGMGVKELLYFDLDKEYDESNLEELMKCDGIHLSGGNTYYFLNLLKKRNMISKIKEYVEKGGVLIGISAGSIIMSETIEAAQFGDYNEIDLKDLNALGLVDFEFMPHWNTDSHYLNDLQQYSKESKKVIYTCNDGDGIIINNNEIKFIGETGKIENGTYIQLKELNENDGMDVYDMIKEIGPGENGFGNSGYNVCYDEFPEYLMKNKKMSKGINLEPQYVPQTMYWLFINGRPVGIGKLRHYLNDNLRKLGGHIGYSIRPSERGKGYGKLILEELLEKAKQKEIKEVLLTCNEDNIPSRKVIEENKGELEEIKDGKCKYWVKVLS